MRSARATALLVAAATLAIPNVTRAQGFTETDLVSDIAGRALHTDPNLVNPWGLVPGPSGVFWAANNHTGTSTLYQADGTIASLVVTIPGGDPTGIVLTNAADSSFVFPSGDTTARAVFIFVSESGVISAWNPGTPTAATQVASTSGAAYLGVAIGGTPSGPRLYASDFAGGKIDVFDRHFNPLTLPYSFVDTTLPAGYSPFNIAFINGELYVAYAMRDAASGDEIAGDNLGIIDVFNTDGLLIRRFTSFGALNAPWGMVVSPPGFGELAGRLLVGNLGDGHINAFSLSNGDLVGAVHTALGDAVVLPGLWGMHFGRPGSAPGAENHLYFAAGIEGETHGLFGYIAPVVRDSVPPVACGSDARGKGFWRHICGSPGEHGDGDDHGHGRDGHGKGHEKDKGQQGDDGDDDHGDGHGHGHDHGIGADSLETLLGCVSNGGGAFGSSGCFTASCDLLRAHGHMRARDRAAQTLLVLLLNRCAGLLCDETVVDCEDGSGPRTVGAVIASLDSALCAGDDVALSRLKRLAGCALGDGDDDDDDDHDGKVMAGRDAPAELVVLTRSANPLRVGAGMSTKLVLTTAAPSVVELKIVDAAGRLIAQPLRSTMVSGTLEVNWDGRDLRGTLVPPGNYFYRASTDKASASGRIVVVR